MWLLGHCRRALRSRKAFAQSDGSDATLLAEVHRAITLHGKPIPPEVFRDFGDGDIADSGAIWVTVDIEAAIGSNLYADDIKKEGDWLSQKRANPSLNGSEETGYKFIGATDNGLLVVLASYNGGGSGTFYTLHILDVATARAFDLDGKLYRRTNLTSLRSVVLGDRWDGKISIAGDMVRIVTTRSGRPVPARRRQRRLRWRGPKRHAAPARSRSWMWMTPTGLPASTANSAVTLVALSNSSVSLIS